MEIQSNELRIGNYVSHFGFTHQVEGIHSKGKLGEKHRHVVLETGVETFLMNLKPIQLTEEWLLKFGFEKKVDEYVFQDFAIEDIHEGKTWCMKEFDYADVCYNAIGKGINYVHELQNVYFALVGEELKIANV